MQFVVKDCTAQLNINDSCPDVSYSSVINAKTSLIKLSDYKGKFLILDFWDTRCYTCIESFPMIDSVQKKFKNGLQILLVTKQERKVVEDFFSRFKKIKLPDVPIITDDVKLASLFPSDGYPYIVWMDTNRVVKYFTNAYNLTADHFEKFLKGIKLKVKEVNKKTVYAPLWHLNDSIFFNNVKYYSTLTSCINGIDIGLPASQLLNDGNLVQLSSNCSTLLSLLKKAFGEDGKYPVNTKYGMKINMDRSLLDRPNDPNLWDEWDKNNKFNYQLILLASKKEFLYKTMQKDLQQYFGISVTRAKKKVKGYVLITLNGNALPVSKNRKSFDAYNNSKVDAADTLWFVNQPLERLISLLRFWISNNFPLKNLVKENKRVDFMIRKASIEPLNIKKLNQDLKRVNLELKQADIETDVLTIGK